MTFAYPFVLIAPLVYLLARTLGRKSAPRAVPAASVPFLRSLPRGIKVRVRKPTLLALETITIVSLAIAGARPQRTTLLDQPSLARNIMLVIDTSRSMSAADFPSGFGSTTRMEGVKTVVSEYVRSRSGDRVGLIVFGNKLFLLSPLTSDTLLVDTLVQSLQPRMAGDGTAIGDGLGLALKRLRDVDAASKAIILITDGVNTAGQVSPRKAAQIARDLGVQVHTIGIGTGRGALESLLGAPVGQVADFDEAALKEIARITGGVYFNATSLEGFQEVYRQLDKLLETEEERPDHLLVEELFAPLALVSICAFFLSVTLQATLFRKVP